VEDKIQEICKIFKCSSQSLMRWVKRYEKKEYVKFLVDEINKNK
jgi:hypothetical protein